MKKIFTLLTICFLGVANIKAQYVTIPDATFRAYLQTKYPTAFNGAGKMDTTNSLIVNADSLECGGKNISSMSGLEYFKNLVYLNCSNTFINSLPKLPNTLKSFNLSGTPIYILPAVPNTLEELYFSGKSPVILTQIPSSLPDSLKILSIYYSYGNSLPSLPPRLKTLTCSGNTMLKCLPKLPSTLKELTVENVITCLPNLPNNNFTMVVMSGTLPGLYTLPVCNSTNNANNCQIYPPNYVNIPDTSFGKFLLAQYPSCLYKDASNLYWMDTTCGGVVNETSLNLDISNNKPDTVRSIEGVEYFKNLNFLNCNYNAISFIKKIPEKLVYFYCSFQLQGNGPGYFSTVLNSLPLLPKTIKFLTYSTNNINDSVPTLPDSLIYLDCSSNDIKHNLPTLPKTLKRLICNTNMLDSLPMLPDSLIYLETYNNYLTSLPQLPQTLEFLDCSTQDGLFFPKHFTHLPILPNSLKTLHCEQNAITNLPQLPEQLEELYCIENDIYCLPKLPRSLTTLYTDFGSKINCVPNQFFGNALYNYPICNPTNNINQCKSFPTVAGRVFTDNNSNGIKDTNEFYRPFVKELASNGDATFSNLNGAFAFSFDSTGSYSLKTIAPKYFKAVPDSNSFSFANNNVYIAVPDIALQSTTVKDSLAIVVTPLNSRARPGFSFPYHLGYANEGTTNLYTTVSFTYDTSRLVYDSSSVAIISHTNNTIVVSADSLVAGQGKYAQLYFTLKPTAVIGDSLFAVANAASNATTATSTNTTIITGSFDPNDKVATPQLTPTQVTNGDWIEYTIRFQNTGNDTAINVVLADTLSILLQPGYFNVISTSHLANLTYSFNNNIVYFEFLNIYLPDSTTNYSGSQGWITFKVKPLVGVAVGTYIDNKASIYFDYNKPIVTNVARTLISTIVPVKLLSYSLRLTQADKKSIENVWSTANEINASHFNIQRSIDGVNFKTVGQVKAVGVSSYSFIDNSLNSNEKQKTIFYRLQMVGNDGRFEYSPIREINLQPSISNIRLYPNPAKDIVTIECANAKEILIADYFGRIVYSSTVSSRQSRVNIKQFAKGIYLVQVVLDNGSIKTEKLIVE